MGGLRRTVGFLVELADLSGGLILIAVTIINLAAVFMRYVMLDSIAWSEEVIRYAGVWLTFLAAAAVSWRNEHLSLELLTTMGGPTARRIHRASLHLLASIFCAVVLWQGVDYCLRNGLQTAPTTGMLMVYAYGAIAVGGALMLLVETVRFIDSLTLPLTEEDNTQDSSA